jgi:hypothetical protein
MLNCQSQCFAADFFSISVRNVKEQGIFATADYSQ